eukprot:COSAG06_NODE_90_length_24779_cov_33.515843_5_plen_56_part_00
MSMYLASHSNSQLKSKFDAAQCNLNTNSTFVTWCLHRRDANMVVNCQLSKCYQSE